MEEVRNECDFEWAELQNPMYTHMHMHVFNRLKVLHPLSSVSLLENLALTNNIL